MKKTISIILLIIMVFNPLFVIAEEVNNQILYLYGIGDSIGARIGNRHEHFRSAIPAQAAYIAQQYGRSNGSQPDRQVVIGQSHGGIRALAYARIAGMNNTEQNNLFRDLSYNSSSRGLVRNPRHSDLSMDRNLNIPAVITINSPVSGHNGIRQGEYLYTRVNSAINTLTNGAASIVPALPALLSLTGITSGDDTFQEIVNGVGLGNSDDPDSIAAIADLLANSPEEAHGLMDLDPNSSFIQNWVIPNERTYVSGGYWRRRIIRYRWQHRVVYVNTWFGRIPRGIAWYRVPVYRWFYIPRWRTSITSRINMPNTRLYNIIGTQRNPLDMIATKIDQSGGDGETTRDITETAINAYTKLVHTSRNIWRIGTVFGAFSTVVLSAAFPGIGTVAGFGSYLTCVSNLSYATSAYRWISNYEDRYNSIIGANINAAGERSSDGLIPEANQRIGGYTSRQVGFSSEGREILLSGINHASSVDHEAIWGSGQGMYYGDNTGEDPQERIGDGGVLYSILYYTLFIDPSVATPIDGD